MVVVVDCGIMELDGGQELAAVEVEVEVEQAQVLLKIVGRERVCWMMGDGLFKAVVVVGEMAKCMYEVQSW